MVQIGIEKITFYTPEYVLNMSTLAKARNIPVSKLTLGLGQEMMAVPPVYEDAVTMAANAANQLLSDEDKRAIDLILVGSESGVDNSKSIAVYVKELCGIHEHVRAVELKQACYGATMALQLAKSHIVDYPESKVLVIASDIAKYGLNSAGEPTQGAGAVAMLISANPKVAVLNRERTFLTRDIMDFWRPVYSPLAFADGKFSTQQYLEFFTDVFTRYLDTTNETLDDFAAICFHQPFTKLGLKALGHVLDQLDETENNRMRLLSAYHMSRLYNQMVGNIYTGSLYLSLISLLETSNSLRGGDKIGLFSYGSGAVGEFFTLTLCDTYKENLFTSVHKQMLENRQLLTIEQYEDIFSVSLPEDGQKMEVDAPSHIVVLSGVDQHIRQYRPKNEVMLNRLDA
ncbi:hydroxymethylglutaryl-CoA synthase [Carnobacteriaceae bacterium zg-ZUI252]|nr:hydroxymethylglutaryl-CoA synthase [Carnobacteriaceae bacterium zg-ZUI252]MBS4769808.1 hydroxymethylglutaryl-CoA synthase [Carnobacteriaceae bacterium zg-ZUI240]